MEAYDDGVSVSDSTTVGARPGITDGLLVQTWHHLSFVVFDRSVCREEDELDDQSLCSLILF